MNIPNGFKLVPVNPTQEMLIAGYAEVPAEVLLCTAWCAMIDAAPIPPQPIYDEAKERELFEKFASLKKWNLSPEVNNCGIVVAERYSHPKVQIALEAWLACAQSRAKAWEVGHE